MTVMAVEAAGSGAAESGAAAGGGAARGGSGITRDQLLSSPRSGARPLGGSPGPRSIPPARTSRPPTGRPADMPTRTSTRSPSSSSTTRSSQGSSPSGDREQRPQRQQAAGGSGGSGGGVPGLRGGGTYHRIVLAEFVLTIILIGASPILTPRKGDSGSPQKEASAISFAAPVVRLTAACIVFFALALAANGEKSGKIAAAFGGLIVLGTLLNATDMFKALAQVFAPVEPADSGTGGGDDSGSGDSSGPPVVAV